MKLIGFIFLALLGLTYAAPQYQDGQLHIPDKCSDVLAVKVCDNLEAIAKRLKLKAEDVTKAVVDAVKKGKTSSVEIYNAAKDFLINEVATKKCEDFTTVENCQKLRKVAAFMKLNAEKVEEFVRKAVAEGAVQAADIYAKAMEYYKNEIKTKKCEDLLSVSQCTYLRNLAGKLKVKFDDLEDAIKDAYLETLGDAKALVTKVVAVLKDYALNTKCEDLLNPDLCSALRRFAATTKVQFPVLMEKAVDLLISGYSAGKSLLNGIFKAVDYFYDCTDVFDQSSCDKLKKVAEFIGFGVQEVEEFIKKYVPIAVQKGKDLIKNFPEMMKELGKYLKDKICDNTILCDDAQLSDEQFIFADQVGIFDWDLIKQKIKEYIEIKYPGLQDKVKQRVLDIISKATSVRDLLWKAAQEIVMVGGEHAATIKQILKDLVANIKNIVNPQTTYDAVAEDEIALFDYDLIKQKIKEYIEIKYPGLQDKVKQKVLDVVNRATNVADLVKESFKEIWQVGGEHAAFVKQILKDLIANIKNIVSPSVPQISYDAVSRLQALKDKIMKYIEAKYPKLTADIKAKIQNIFDKATNIGQIIANAISELLRVHGDNADIVKQIIRDLIKKVKDELKSGISKRSVDFDELKNKLKEYLENKVPQLQAQIKEQLKAVIDKAQSKFQLIREFIKTVWQMSKDKKDEVVKVVKELIEQLKNFN
ncbi:uncharacterized protein [Clytia hemisphaerica]|uniref:Uncharacterized protein n=1 Tax=Clytia hemisphaerica TaxID=252671 RepID=A0A7M5WWU3_9CNID